MNFQLHYFIINTCKEQEGKDDKKAVVLDIFGLEVDLKWAL